MNEFLNRGKYETVMELIEGLKNYFYFYNYERVHQALAIIFQLSSIEEEAFSKASDNDNVKKRNEY